MKPIEAAQNITMQNNIALFKEYLKSLLQEDAHFAGVKI